MSIHDIPSNFKPKIIDNETIIVGNASIGFEHFTNAMDLSAGETTLATYHFMGTNIRYFLTIQYSVDAAFTLPVDEVIADDLGNQIFKSDGVAVLPTDEVDIDAGFGNGVMYVNIVNPPSVIGEDDTAYIYARLKLTQTENASGDTQIYSSVQKTGPQRLIVAD